jgi:hypothetical protein
MNLLRSSNWIGNLKYTISPNRIATKRRKNLIFMTSREVRYEGLDASGITIVGKTPEVYKIQFLDCVTVTV